MASAPLVAAMHDRFPEAIEEEVDLLDLDVASYVLEWHARVPDWRDYYLSLDQHRHYAYLKKVLQALTFLRGPRTWILKSPQHCEQLGPLIATFPDATVAFTHRDPVAVIQSAITMMAYSDRLRRTSIDPGWLLDYWADRVHRLLSACVRDVGDRIGCCRVCRADCHLRTAGAVSALSVSARPRHDRKVARARAFRCR